MIKVKEMSYLLGVDRSFLHYYDDIGIIVPEKNDKNYRYYSANDLMALASSKFYRSMEMSLKQLGEMILISDEKRKLELMADQKKALERKAELLSDMAVVAGYAIETYKSSYNKTIVEGDSIEFEFIPMFDGEKIITGDEEYKEGLLNFFPFVSYTYYFKENALIDENQFGYTIGLATLAEFRRKYEVPLPESHIYRESKKAIIYSIDVDKDLAYSDFEALRKYAIDHGLVLTGEAIAYYVFSNYKIENAQLKLLVYCYCE